MTRQGKFLLVGLAIIALVVPTVGGVAVASPGAHAASEGQSRIITKGHLKISKRIKVKLGCSVNCSLRAASLLKVKGGRIKLKPLRGSFAAGSAPRLVLTPNGAAVRRMKADPGAARLVLKVSSKNLTTKAKDVDRRVFKFKK